jgi:hypothetical protein
VSGHFFQATRPDHNRPSSSVPTRVSLTLPGGPADKLTTSLTARIGTGPAPDLARVALRSVVKIARERGPQLDLTRVRCPASAARPALDGHV